MSRSARPLVKPYVRISRIRLSLHDFLFHSYLPFTCFHSDAPLTDSIIADFFFCQVRVLRVVLAGRRRSPAPAISHVRAFPRRAGLPPEPNMFVIPRSRTRDPASAFAASFSQDVRGAVHQPLSLSGYMVFLLFASWALSANRVPPSPFETPCKQEPFAPRSLPASSLLRLHPTPAPCLRRTGLPSSRAELSERAMSLYPVPPGASQNDFGASVLASAIMTHLATGDLSVRSIEAYIRDFTFVWLIPL